MRKLPRLHFAVMMSKTRENAHQIYIYDDVREHGDFNWETWSYEESETSAKHFRELLKQIPEDHEIELFINSNGGSVKEGVSIYNQLQRHGAKKTGYVDGVAHSIAFVILQACDHRIMGEGTSALIHEMWVCTCGNARELREEADQLDVLMESNRALFMKRAKNITEEQLKEMMEKETILTPDKALEYGFIDEIQGREGAPPEDGAQQAANIRDMRNMMQNNGFKDALEEFKKLAKPASEPEPEETSTMDVFFNIFK